jgi:nitrate/nitrite transport system substrate-binding protein
MSKNSQNSYKRNKLFSRRDFIRGSVAGVVAGALSGCGQGSGVVTNSASASQSGNLEKSDLTLGFIPLTDCSPLVIASEKGLYKKYGLNCRIKKMASWAATRDAIQKGEIDAAHILTGMIVGFSTGAADVGKQVVRVPMCVLQSLNVNGQAITLQKSHLDAGIRTPSEIKSAIVEKQLKLTFAGTFPVGTHAMWIRYWLASGGVHPDKDIKLITIPPPQMVANMKTGNMDGFCVGEPWGAQAVEQNIGFTATTTQGIWKNHPEKVLGCTEAFAHAHPRTCAALIAGTLEACRWLDDLKNRPEAAEIIGKTEYVNCKPETIRDRMLGKYVLAPGASVTDEPDYMKFLDNNASVPYLSHAVWFMTQHRRWGMLADKLDYAAEARRIMRHDLYTEGCKLAGISSPEQMESRGKETLFDGTVFDPADPEGYAQQFKVKNI